MGEQLIKCVNQLREVNNVLELCERFLAIDDDFTENTINEASTNIDNAANAIAKLIGREILSKEFYGQSQYKIEQDDEDPSNHNERKLSAKSKAKKGTSISDDDEYITKLDEFQRVTDQAEEILNKKTNSMDL